LESIIENTLNTIRNIKNTSENIKNRIGKQHNQIGGSPLIGILGRATQQLKIVVDPSHFSD